MKAYDDIVTWLVPIDRTTTTMPTRKQAAEAFSRVGYEQWHDVMATRGWAWYPKNSDLDLECSIRKLLREVKLKKRSRKVEDSLEF